MESWGVKNIWRLVVEMENGDRMDGFDSDLDWLCFESFFVS